MTRITAVVPTYRPDREVSGRLRELAKQVDSLIVVDDGSGAEFEPVLDELDDVAELVRLETNVGIAGALNVGIRRALAAGADYVLTVDQDSELPRDYVATAHAIFERANAVTRLGIVGVDAVNGAPAKPPWISPEGFGLVPETIQTGSLISEACLRVAGLLDERLVIDTVDTEYCIRARDHGFRIAVATGTDITHAIGRRAELRPFGVPLRHANGRIASYQYHAPLRRYYIARNNIDLMLRYWRTHRRWVLVVAKRETGVMIVSMVSGPQRLAQVLAIGVGTLHGLIRRRGRIPGWLARAVAR